MNRGLQLTTVLPRVLVVALLLLALLAAFKWGQYSRHLSIRSHARDASPLFFSAPLGDSGSSSAAPRDANSTEPWIETISWSPRVFVFHNFISHEDCDHIVTMGMSYVTRSEVVGTTGNSVQHEARSSSGVFLTGSQSEDVSVKKVAKGIAEWTQIPEPNGEVFYLIRYEVGQQYKPHYDYFSNDANGAPFIGSSGNRMATVLTYLSTPEEGGETVFPEAQLTVKARKGDAVLFFNMHPDGSVDPRSLHGGLPVVKGVKWAMTRWIRQKAF